MGVCSESHYNFAWFLGDYSWADLYSTSVLFKLALLVHSLNFQWILTNFIVLSLNGLVQSCCYFHSLKLGHHRFVMTLEGKNSLIGKSVFVGGL